MRILVIDLGSYAVKFIETMVERKAIKILDQHSVVLEKVRPQLKGIETREELHFAIIKSYLETNEFEGKIYFQLPETLTTSRFLTLPVSQRRKAEMMIPFQLEENLPFPSGKIHTTSSLSKINNKETKAVVNIAELDTFDAYYEVLKTKDIIPAVLTSELSWIHSYAYVNNIDGPIALIDFGHETTKCYFIYNKQVVSNHISHIAGDSIDEMIAHTYSINPHEAVLYKHENCFLLTEQQYGGVDEEQAHFARLMKQTLQPLILELKRWEVGFRVKYGHPVEKILLTGGSANIHNAANFFTQVLNLPVEVFNPYKDMELTVPAIPNHNQLGFGLVSMAAKATLSKVEIANFLYGQYASDYNQNIPVYSTMFIATRALIICLLISFVLLGERFIFLNQQENEMDRRVSRESILERNERAMFRRAPERLLTKYQSQNQKIEQEVSMISSALELNALTPLVRLSELLSSNENIDLIFFRSQDKFVEAKFKSEDINELETLRDFLLNSGFSELSSEINENDKVLEVSFREDS
jgi:Tfp pilus assembly PilM family ATPase